MCRDRAFGNEAYILTGYFNLPKIFEITLNNGFDKRTGKQIGLETGKATDLLLTKICMKRTRNR
mgnify:CR=1 FL=1